MNGVFNCLEGQCQNCSFNQIYSQNASSCPMTCENYNNFHCSTYNEGCTCPDGQVFDYNVNNSNSKLILK